MELKAMENYPDREAFVEAVSKRTFENELRSHGCAQVVVQSFLDELGLKNPDLTRAASPFFAGIALTGGTCGALIGPLMILGVVFGRQDISQGLPGLLGGIRPQRKFIKKFQSENRGLSTCRELTGVNMASPEESQKFFQAGGLERCARMMARAAGDAAGMIFDEYRAQKDKSGGDERG